jgi:hypothetical protein
MAFSLYVLFLLANNGAAASIAGFSCSGPAGFRLDGKVMEERAGRSFGLARLHWGLSRKQFSFRLDPDFKGGPWLMLFEGEPRFDSGFHFFGTKGMGNGVSVSGVYGRVLSSPFEANWSSSQGVQPMASVNCRFSQHLNK